MSQEEMTVCLKAKTEVYEGQKGWESIESASPRAWSSILADLRKKGMQALTWENIHLSGRARNALTRNGLLSVWDCAQTTRQQIERLQWLGTTIRAEVFLMVKAQTGIVLEQWRD